MATYAIGDLQGCYEPLERLLDLLAFDSRRDRLWFVGDLVNRGPESLRVLRFVRTLGDACVTVLGNHDLHLLAVAYAGREQRADDTLGEILAAPDRDELLDWLRRQPLVHVEDGHTLVHAGLPPQWSVEQALERAQELCSVLSAERPHAFLKKMYGAKPARWDEQLSGVDRLRFITNALTRIRYCRADLTLEFKEKRDPGAQPPGLTPWYAVPGRRSEGEAIVFGHWATLQRNAPLDAAYGVHHVDNGCVWGGRLTALRLEDKREFSVPAVAA